MPIDAPVDDPVMSRDRELLTAWDELLPGHRQLGERLLARYSEPHRAYHNVDHLRYVLGQAEALAPRDFDLFFVRLAAWFHDAVYEVPERELTNEEASARLAVRELIDTGMDQEDINEVTRLVRLTETHLPPPGDKKGRLLCDADLAILAAEPGMYQGYVDAVRVEHPSVDDDTFAAARLQVLERFVSGDIFRTSKGRKLAAAAQTNVRTECRSRCAQLGIDFDAWLAEREDPE